MIGYVWHRPGVTIPQALEELGQLPPRGDLSWYAWNAHTLQLPGVLAEESLSQFKEDWDVCCVFGDHLEIRYRYFPREAICWVSLEDSSPVLEKMRSLAASQTNTSPIGTVKQYSFVRKTRRILWGRKLHLVTGETRGEVAFPRPLEYIPAGKDHLDSAVVVDAFQYLDADSGQSWIRYARLQLLPPNSWKEHILESAKSKGM